MTRKKGASHEVMHPSLFLQGMTKETGEDNSQCNLAGEIALGKCRISQGNFRQPKTVLPSLHYQKRPSDLAIRMALESVVKVTAISDGKNCLASREL
jgi:hypothetical protein